MNSDARELLDQSKIESDPLKKARLLIRIVRDYSVRVKDVAIFLETTPAYICNMMRLVKLPEIVVDGYYAKNLTLTHLLVLSRLKTIEDMVATYETILKDDLPVSAVESLVRNRLYGVSTDGTRLTEEKIQTITNAIQKIDPNFQVNVIQTRIKATINLTIKGNLSKTTQTLTKLTDLVLKK